MHVGTQVAFQKTHLVNHAVAAEASRTRLG